MESKTASSNEKLAALQKAVDAHEKLIKEAISGQGIDRHLFGLQQMALENEIPLPEFFLSTGFVRSVTFQLFTSQVATSHAVAGGAGGAGGGDAVVLQLQPPWRQLSPLCAKWGRQIIKTRPNAVVRLKALHCQMSLNTTPRGPDSAR